MVNLIVEHNGRRSHVNLGGRVTIGRNPSNHVVINAEGIQPIHGQITSENGRFVFIAAHDRALTYINNVVVRGSCPLQIGDWIPPRTGPALASHRSGA